MKFGRRAAPIAHAAPTSTEAQRGLGCGNLRLRTMAVLYKGNMPRRTCEDDQDSCGWSRANGSVERSAPSARPSALGRKLRRPSNRDINGGPSDACDVMRSASRARPRLPGARKLMRRGMLKPCHGPGYMRGIRTKHGDCRRPQEGADGKRRGTCLQPRKRAPR